jgi:CheY-like chemotaxis protein
MFDGSRPVVLVVEDNEAARYAVAHQLEHSGFQVITAHCGDDALRLARSAQALVLDVHLPDIDGYEVCRRLKADPVTALIPVVFLTATAQDTVGLQRGKQVGGAAYLFEPVDKDVLKNVLTGALARVAGGSY